MITHEKLVSALSYCPETGEFKWLKSGKGRRSDLRAGVRAANGYHYICIFNKDYLAHRLAWFYQTGEWPKNQIDHINGVRNDNRFINLREATRSENMMNCRIHKDNKSGRKGVTFDKLRGKFCASIRINNRRKNLGYFENSYDAHAAYDKAAHEFFGDFARAM